MTYLNSLPVEAPVILVHVNGFQIKGDAHEPSQQHVLRKRANMQCLSRAGEALQEGSGGA